MRIRSIRNFSQIGAAATALGAVLTCGRWERPAAAEPAEVGERVLLGAIINSCQNFDDGYRAISARLRQVGATVEPPPMGPNDCIGLDCAAKLKGQSAFLLGGQVSAGQSTLWVADLARDQVLVQRHVGYGVDWPGNLARQAAALVEQLHDPQAPWKPRAQVPTCGEPPATSADTPFPSSKEGMSAEPRVVLAVHAPRSVGKYAADFQKGVRRSLGEMGLQVREVHGVAPPANPRDALPAALKDLPLVDVQLLAPEHDKTNSTPDGAVVRLSDGRRATQISIECAVQDCEPAQLVQFVRRNAVALLDRSIEETSASSGAATLPAACLPPDSCRAVSLAQVGTSRAVQQPDSSPAPSVIASRPESEGSTNDEQGLPPPSPPPRRSATPYLVGGGILMGLGVAALATSAALAGLEGKLDGSPEDRVWSNKPLFSVGFVLGAGSIVGGGVLFWQAKKRNISAR